MIEIVVVPVHKFPSVPVIVYIVFAHKPAKFPLVGCVGPAGNILKVYAGKGLAGVPPEPLTETEPSQTPPQLALLLVIIFTIT